MLSSVSTPYRDGLKTDILIYLGEFNTENPELKFLKKFNSKAEINLLSHIILKYNEESKQLSCFISEYTLITDYRILVSEYFNDFQQEKSIQDFFIKYNHQKINLSDKFFPSQQFLDWHYQQLFIKYKVLAKSFV